MTDGPPLADFYRETRERLSAVVLTRIDDDALPVPATPGWCVHDVVAHLTGVAEDVAGGWAPTGGPTEEWTAGHVARGAGVPTGELVEKWAALSPAVEDVLRTRPVWPIALDVGAHELDVRGALGDRAARHSDIVRHGAAWLIRALRVPRPLVVRTDVEEVRVGPGDDPTEPAVLTTTAFEAFRWRLGRRSRAQLRAMDWRGDPEPFLDRLCVFGPAAADLVE